MEANCANGRGPTRPLRSAPTRAAILKAARRLFARDGFERATIRAIAAEAGRAAW